MASVRKSSPVTSEKLSGSKGAPLGKSRPLKEGERVFNASHIILCGLDDTDTDTIRGLSQTLHYEITRINCPGFVFVFRIMFTNFGANRTRNFLARHSTFF